MAKILVADDNSNIQKMVGLALKDQGIDVVAVGNGEAAVRKISDVRPDLVLADVFMPVRNGYEVCRYVKEDSALSHIPVILLVGAFDPLDEQEAQRVGADGVLKKPFVPPDPLISMVKSALTRAGVSLGPAPVAEKPAPAPSRTGADILSGGAGSKLTPFAAEKLPEATPEPIEEFPAPPAPMKIPAGQGPLAFGSLLDTPETEEEPIFSSKPMINIAQEHKWDEETNDVPEEEDEEELAKGGWHPDGMEEESERAASSSKSAPDWRDQAFHGDSPAKDHSSHHWAPSHERSNLAEAAEAPAVAISTIESKPVEGLAPFASDAWAAAMAAGVEEKIAEAEAKAPVPVAPEPVTDAAPKERAVEELPGTVAASLEAPHVESTPPAEEAKSAEPGNWAAVPESTWEVEAKRASMLASTWDSAIAPATEETQEVSAYVGEQPETHTEHSETPVEAPSAYSGHWEAESDTQTPVETAAPDTVGEPEAEGAVPKSWANAWEMPAAETAPKVEEVAQTEVAQHVEAVAQVEHVAEPQRIEEPVAPVIEQAHAHEPEPVAEAAPAQPTQAAQPDMDELVARVLGKMNPEVLQRVTHEILKPLIEAIVRDELNSKRQ